MDYKKIADLMQAMPVTTEVLAKNEFELKTKQRKLSFIQEIDTTEDGTTREVWGNKLFQMIVLHKGNNYRIL